VNPVRDPGLQAERTALAWNRTALAMLANGLLTLRAGVQTGEVELLGFGLLMLALAAAGAATGWIRRRQLATGSAAAPAVWLMAGTAAAVLVAALGALRAMQST